CPHRLSDKLLKSSATALSTLSRGGVYYAFLSQSQPHFSEVFSFNPAACLPLFRVDGGAL
ncbi:hypothetical protein DJ495_13490, partial [Raoultella ornithinolytica]|uniref:hypothetical protein n=1 Tax=Raoultella ornithinolytica TaxID=54291 RepID=UPI001133E84E